MNYTIIKKENLQPALWEGGKTFEYFIYPEDAVYSERNFLFRVSSATIEKVPSSFTRFENFTRYLIMLDNHLKINHNGIEENYSENEVFRFDSDDIIVSQSSGTDFNLIVAEPVQFSSVKILSDLQNVTHDFMLIFAKTETKIQFGAKEIMLTENDLLCIENPENENLTMKSTSHVIVGLISI